MALKVSLAMNQDLTTLICLYHSPRHAQTAMEKILEAGVPEANVTLVGAEGSNIATSRSTLTELNVPEKDVAHLLDGISAGGAVLSVAALSDHVDAVKDIFDRYAKKIDEVDLDDDMSAAALPVATALPLAEEMPAASAGPAVIPIVEEEMNVGKRTVDAGGVRVYRRIVEIPVEESVTLREEHVTVDRHMVDRPVTDADLRLQGNVMVELTESAEEAVVGKTARVVEEVQVGKVLSEHTEHIEDTVRRTEVGIEEIEPAETAPAFEGRPRSL